MTALVGQQLNQRIFLIVFHSRTGTSNISKIPNTTARQLNTQRSDISSLTQRNPSYDIKSFTPQTKDFSYDLNSKNNRPTRPSVGAAGGCDRPETGRFRHPAEGRTGRPRPRPIAAFGSSYRPCVCCATAQRRRRGAISYRKLEPNSPLRLFPIPPRRVHPTTAIRSRERAGGG